MFILDTNVVSELRKVRKGKASPHVARWADSVDAISLHISVITILEIERGILQIARKDATQASPLRAWFENQVLPAFEGRIIPVNTAIARSCAALHVPNPHAERDALIAATALVHRMTLVTRNVADFQTTGVPILNPWHEPP